MTRLQLSVESVPSAPPAATSAMLLFSASVSFRSSSVTRSLLVEDPVQYAAALRRSPPVRGTCGSITRTGGSIPSQTLRDLVSRAIRLPKQKERGQKAHEV
jgi:hypothetical protein